MNYHLSMQVIFEAFFFSIFYSAVAQVSPDAEEKPPYWQNTVLLIPIKAYGIQGTSFSPDGRSVYFVDYKQKNSRPVMITSFSDGKWSVPDTIEPTEKFRCADPFISPDGSSLYFANFTSSPPKIFVTVKTGNKWSEAKLLSDAGSFPGTIEWQVFPTLAENGNIYFAGGEGDIYFSPYVNEVYSEPIILPETINTKDYPEWDACISRQENILIFCSKRPDTRGESDLYISCKKNGRWLPAMNLGTDINSDYYDGFPGFSPEGKYLFFIRDNNGEKVVYQIDLKPIVDRYLRHVSEF
jgi:hypothetical protein